MIGVKLLYHDGTVDCFILKQGVNLTYSVV